MKPEISRVLEVMAGALMVDVAPHVMPSYRQASVFASALTDPSASMVVAP